MKPKVEAQTRLDKQEMKEMLAEMWRIRLFEEKIVELAKDGHIYGTYHLSTGEEATAVGATMALKKSDLMTSTHRNHGHCLAKGTDMYRMFAEIMGKKTGINKGKGGSMHITDTNVGNLGSNGIVAAGFPIAAGAALAAQMNETKEVVLCFAGDGSVNEGAFHETLNLASIWKLPVVFFIENNQYGMSSAVDKMVNIEHLSERASAYNIPGMTIDGNDVELVYETTKDAVDFARCGNGPTLIEAMTYRHAGHSKSDKFLYRTREEENEWKTKNDPILRFETKMIQQSAFTQDEILEIYQEVKEEVIKASEKAKSDDLASPADLLEDVYYGKIGEMFRA